MRLRPLFCLAAISLATRASAQGSIPATAVGKVLSAWLDMYHSGDSARMVAFNRHYAPTVPPTAGLAMRRNLGDVDFIKILKDEPQHLDFLLRGAIPPTWDPRTRSSRPCMRRSPEARANIATGIDSAHCSCRAAA